MNTTSTVPAPQMSTTMGAQVMAMAYTNDVDQISSRVGGMTQVNRNIAGSILLTALGLANDTEKRDILDVIRFANNASNTVKVDKTTLYNTVNKLAKVIIDNNTLGLLEMLQPEPAPAPAAATHHTLSAPRRTPEQVDAALLATAEALGKRGVVPTPAEATTIPAMAKPTEIIVPEIVINPSDPMTSMAAVTGRILRPLIEAIAQQRVDHSITGLLPIVDSIRGAIAELAARPVGGGGNGSAGINADEVGKIIMAKLSNGAGDELRRVISSSSASIFSDVLDKAASAIAAQGGGDPSQAVLSAATTPEVDKKYSWDPTHLAVMELMHKGCQVKPQNAMLIGPTGSGKTELGMEAAARYGMGLMIMDCANLREGRDWFGIKGVSNGQTYFRKSQFWLAIEKGNVVIVFDEFNRASDMVRNPLMPLLDHRRRTFVEEVGATLSCGPRIIFLATVNLGREYTGTHDIDRALKSRFPRLVEVHYLTHDREVSVLMEKVDGLKKEDAVKLVELANVVRGKAVTLNGLTETISTRQLIGAAEDYVIGGPQSFQHTIFNHFPAEDGVASERAQIINMWQLKGYKFNAK